MSTVPAWQIVLIGLMTAGAALLVTNLLPLLRAG